MTERTTKRHYVIVTLLVILIAITASLVVMMRMNHNEAKEKERVVAKEKKDAIRTMSDYVKHDYELLKVIAPHWNKIYAKLTLDHTRDTVEHSEYNVTEFAEDHRSLMSYVKNFERNQTGVNSVHLVQIPNIFPVGAELQHLIGTIRIKEQFSNDIKELDRQYRYILSRTKKTEVVDLSSKDIHSPFLYYFELLRRMDETFYAMLESRYPFDLRFLLNTYPDFVDYAKRQLFMEQTSTVADAYYALQQNGIQPEKNIKVLPKKNVSDTTVTLYTSYKNGDKALIVSYTDKDIHSLTNEQRVAFVDSLSALVPIDEYETKRYFYLRSQEAIYYANDTNKMLYPLVLEGDDTEILEFYDGGNEPYYVTKGYNPFDVFYLGYNRE